MANKREFKKYAEALGASIIEEMTFSYYNVEGIDKEKVSEALKKVLGAVGMARANSNIFFDRGRKAFDDNKGYAKAKRTFFKQLFDKIVKDYSTSIDEALKLFNSALPKEALEANKKSAE